MILRTKPYTVGCGIHLNPHGNDTRCGQLPPKSSDGEIVLCDNCIVRRRANQLIEAKQAKEKAA